MKLIIIFGILAVAYLVYCSLTTDVEPTETFVEKLPAVEEVSMPDKEFKNAIKLAAGIAVLIASLIATALLL